MSYSHIENMNKKYLYWVQILVSTIILIVILINLNISELYKQSTKINFFFLLAVILILIPNLLIRSYRWKYLYDSKSNNIGIVDSIRLWFVGAALNLILPATSGDVFKSYFGYKWSGVKERMLSISLLDKVIALASIALLGIPFSLYLKNILYAGLSLFVITPLAFLFLLPKLLSRFEICKNFFFQFSKLFKNRLDLKNVIHESGLPSSKMLFALLLSAIGWLLAYLQLFYCLNALNVDVSLYYIFSVAPLLTLIRLFPFSLNGIGTDEAAIVFLISGPQISPEAVLAGSLIYKAVMSILPGTIGLIFLSSIKKIEAK